MRQPTDFLTLINSPPEPVRKAGRWLGLPQPCVLPDAIALPAEGAALPEEPWSEPFLEAGPVVVERAETRQLDPTRTDQVPAAPISVIVRLARWALTTSFAFHALTVLWLVVDTSKPPDIVPPTPISLVLEAPAPEAPTAEPPAPPAPEPPPPPGPLASQDMGHPDASPTRTGAAPPKPTDAPVAAKPAEPLPPPPPPKPTPPPERVAAATPPKPAPPSPPAPRPASVPSPHPDQPALAGAHYAAVPGAPATRDEYLAYLVTLTRQHFDQVPMSLIGDRHGETSLVVVVLADGTIARISVLRGSGYPEIDERIERMVAAVGRFPPLPDWYHSQSMDLVFRLRFPEGLRLP